MTPEDIAFEIRNTPLDEPSCVLDIIRQALAAERERCAKIAEGFRDVVSNPHMQEVYQHVADAIRKTENRTTERDK